MQNGKKESPEEVKKKDLNNKTYKWSVQKKTTKAPGRFKNEKGNAK